MAPSEAEKLNIEQARFYLADAKTIRGFCQRVHKRHREMAGRKIKTKTEIAADAREYMRKLREFYTGSSEVEGHVVVGGGRVAADGGGSGDGSGKE